MHLRRNSLSRPWRAYEQHGVSLSELSARRSVAGRRLDYFSDSAISAASWASGGVSFVRARAPHLLCELRQPPDVRASRWGRVCRRHHL